MSFSQGCEGEPSEATVRLVARWLYESGLPYTLWFWGNDQEKCRRELEIWARRKSSELYAGRFTILSHNDAPVGGYIAMSGSEIPNCRKSDMLAAIQSTRKAGNSGLLDRMHMSRGIFALPRVDEFYLSRLAVSADSRLSGFGHKLTEHFLSVGRARGFQRFRLDVSSANKKAIDLYKSHGFQIESELQCERVPFSYCSMIRLTEG